MGIYDTDDNDDDFDQEPPEDNRAIRQLRQAERAAKKRVQELEAELAKINTANRGRAIKDVLQDKGLTNPKIANLVPPDIEPTAEAVSAWLEEYGDVFGGSPVASEQPVVPEGTDLDQLRSIDQISLGNTGSPKAGAELLNRIENAQSQAELDALIAGMSG